MYYNFANKLYDIFLNLKSYKILEIYNHVIAFSVDYFSAYCYYVDVRYNYDIREALYRFIFIWLTEQTK